MTVNNYIYAKNIINKEIANLDYFYPQKREKVDEAEKILDVKFPKSYKDFLIRYGSIGFNGEEIYGLNNDYEYDKFVYCNVVCATLNERELSNENFFPKYLIIIHGLGDGEYSCLDTSQMNENGECPVVAWYFGAKLPNGKLEVLAEDFGAFLLEKIRWGLEQ